MGVTLKDIAEQVGVSYETVSRALNNRGRVGKETARRIQEVARRMGYMPNALARGLRIKNTKTLGVVFPCIYENEFYAGIYRGLEEAVLDQGYVLFLCNSNFDNQREATSIRTLAGRRVDAIVMALAEHTHDADSPNADQIRQLRDQFDLPVILVDRGIASLSTDFVASDHRGGARQAVEHLVDQGHRRIGCILTDRASSVRERRDGYRDVLAKYGLAHDPIWEIQTPHMEEEAGREGLRRLLALPDDQRPTAVFITNDLGAIGLMKEAAERGLSIPDDLSIVGFDDLRVSATLPVPLTTIRQNTWRIGSAAGELLMARLEDKRLADHDYQDIRVPTELVTRQSVRPLE